MKLLFIFILALIFITGCVTETGEEENTEENITNTSARDLSCDELIDLITSWNKPVKPGWIVFVDYGEQELENALIDKNCINTIERIENGIQYCNCSFDDNLRTCSCVKILKDNSIDANDLFKGDMVVIEIDETYKPPKFLNKEGNEEILFNCVISRDNQTLRKINFNLYALSDKIEHSEPNLIYECEVI